MARVLDLVTISLYLNLATKRLRSGGGSLNWLTGGTHSITASSGGVSQETQCIAFGSTLWIANNDDTDSPIQQRLLRFAGVRTPADLIVHAWGNAGRVLPRNTHDTSVLSGTGSPKERLLYRIRGESEPGEAFTRPEPTAIASYDLSTGGVPPTGGIAMITGDYDADAKPTFHAEQRLLAALGRYISSRATNAHLGDVPIGGIKAACRRCGESIAAVQTRLTALHLRTTLVTASALAEGLRTKCGIGTEGSDEVAKLKVDTYYPPAPTTVGSTSTSTVGTSTLTDTSTT